MRASLLLALTFTLLGSAPATLSGQSTADPVGTRSGFVREAAGASLGSLVGLGTWIGAEVGTSVPAWRYTGQLTTVAGATAGLYLTRTPHLSRTELGFGVIGAFVGAYVAGEVTRGVEPSRSPWNAAATIATFSVTQGIFTAAGARLYHVLRSR
jgi:hypothetical protein